MLQSIGIAAAPKFKAQEPAIGSFQPSPASPLRSATTSNTQSNASRGRTAKTGASEGTSAGTGASRVSAITSMEDSSAGNWDEDKELDDLIGDD